jgi:hypothetical protein
MILDDFVWSFSRAECFDTCPQCFYLRYIKEKGGIEGVYAQYGSLCHALLEKYAKGELADFELAHEYEDSFDVYVTEPFSYNKYVDLREKYYAEGLEYFSNFNGFGDRKILGIENEYTFKVGKYNFTGKIDLECENEIVDHKTKKSQHLVRLTKKHNREDYIALPDAKYLHYENLIQLYIYSIPYYNKYGKYPQYLSLNMLRAKEWYRAEFDPVFFEKSKQWIVDKIEKIYSAKSFGKGDKADAYWCNNSCDQRLNCSYSDKFLA